MRQLFLSLIAYCLAITSVLGWLRRSKYALRALVHVKRICVQNTNCAIWPQIAPKAPKPSTRPM